MDREEFQEKMDPAHRMNLCRMIGMEQLPECLLEQYVRVKKMIDRIDGRLSLGTLAIIALMAGYNPDTGKFEQTLEETTEGEDARLQAEADKTAVESPALSQTITGAQVAEADASGDAKPVGSLDESDDKAIEEAVEPPVEPPVIGATGQAVEQPTPEEGKSMLWAQGMPVNVLQEDQLKKGKIFGVHPPGDGNEQVQLTITLDSGETITVNEDEVEAV